VKKDEATARLARQVSQALDQMLQKSPECPRDADRFDWSSDVLDELARAVTTIGQVVDRFAGGPRSEGASGDTSGADDEDTIDEKARELATAIVRQRNSLLAEGATRRHHPGPVLPAPPIAAARRS
jgi:hypothetical protein